MPKPRRTKEERSRLKRRAMGFYKGGKSYADVAKELGVSKSTVYYWARSWEWMRRTRSEGKSLFHYRKKQRELYGQLQSSDFDREPGEGP